MSTCRGSVFCTNCGGVCSQDSCADEGPYIRNLHQRRLAEEEAQKQEPDEMPIHLFDASKTTKCGGGDGLIRVASTVERWRVTCPACLMAGGTS